jgi:hypothetical protein
LVVLFVWLVGWLVCIVLVVWLGGWLVGVIDCLIDCFGWFV